jgi:hypothetical protein
MIVLIEDAGAGIHPTRVGPTDRLLARLRASRLDHDLAEGASPESTVALALRAQRLVRPSVCQCLAQSLEQIVADATQTSRAIRSPRIPICRDRVLDSRAELQAVIHRLSAAGPLAAPGVARIQVLLVDGSGPFYQRRSKEALRARLRSAFAALNSLAS